MTQRLDKINNDVTEEVRDSKSNLAPHGPEAQSKRKLSIVTQTKWGIYTIPSMP